MGWERASVPLSRNGNSQIRDAAVEKPRLARMPSHTQQEDAHSPGRPPTRHMLRRYALVDRLLGNVGGRALDCGCGYGDITSRFAPRFSAIVGVDVIAERVDFAARRWPSITFSVCRPDRLDFSDSAFDTVLSVVVLNWVDDPDCYLAEIHRVLRPGGALVLIVSAGHPVQRLLRRLTFRKGPDVDFWYEPLPQLAARLVRRSFEVDRIDFMYDDLRDDAKSVTSLVTAVTSVPFRLARSATHAPYFGLRAVKS